MLHWFRSHILKYRKYWICNCVALDHHSPLLSANFEFGTANEGQDLILSCKVQSSGKIDRYAWKKDNKPLRDESGNELRRNPLKKQDRGDYVCTTYVNGFSRGEDSIGFTVNVNCKYYIIVSFKWFLRYISFTLHWSPSFLV